MEKEKKGDEMKKNQFYFFCNISFLFSSSQGQISRRQSCPPFAGIRLLPSLNAWSFGLQQRYMLGLEVNIFC
jgi:hypothetical protein